MGDAKKKSKDIRENEEVSLNFLLNRLEQYGCIKVYDGKRDKMKLNLGDRTTKDYKG
eukprot:c38159_g1_i1 orf=135-305(+)